MIRLSVIGHIISSLLLHACHSFVCGHSRSQSCDVASLMDSLVSMPLQAAKKEGTKTLQDSPATSGHAPWRPQNAAGGSRRKQ